LSNLSIESRERGYLATMSTPNFSRNQLQIMKLGHDAC
jgi:hypothetical protein